MNVKKNDKVIILAGKDKGKTGEVSKVIPGKNKVVVAGVNMISKHVKPSQKSKGGIQKLEAPLDASNVAVVCGKCKAHMTPKTKIENNGAKTRVCRKCEAVIA
jgi:large subunit ribosomal protein L24